MPKLIVSLLAVCIMAVLFLTFQLSYKVQQTDDNISRLKHLVKQEQQALHVLDAEWAYITRPERLKELAEQYTGMQPVIHSSLITISAIPANGQQASVMLANYKPGQKAKPVTPPAAAQANSFAMAAAPAPAPVPKLAMRAPDISMRAPKDAPATRRASVWDVLNAGASDEAQ
ncbi:hypothetical protein GC177_01410 [bacterium]|nr:hypothetical protein [bacterium]